MQTLSLFSLVGQVSPKVGLWLFDSSALYKSGSNCNVGLRRRMGLEIQKKKDFPPLQLLLFRLFSCCVPSRDRLKTPYR